MSQTYDEWKNDFPEQEYNDPFESENIRECYYYYIETKDCEPIEAALQNQEDIVEIVCANLDYCIGATIKNTSVKNKLINIKKMLMSNQQE
jgi:hypothetical protein